MKSCSGLLRSISILIAITTPINTLAAICGFQPVFKQSDEGGAKSVQVYQGNPVPALENSRPLLFITSLKVNTDGAKISYHQDDVTGRRCASDPAAKPCAINNIRNAYRDHTRPESDFAAVRDAGYPSQKTWQLLSDGIIEKDAKTGKPCITSDGYLVSMTSDVAVAGGFNRQGDCDQSKWIDALTVPALVIPKESRFFTLGVAKRSTVVALSKSDTKRVVPGIVGDAGPRNELGEASIAMNRKLNGLQDSEIPKHRRDVIERFQAGRSVVVVFPGSNLVLPRSITAQRVADSGNDALAKFGGTAKLYDCIRNEVDSSF